MKKSLLFSGLIVAMTLLCCYALVIADAVPQKKTSATPSLSAARPASKPESRVSPATRSLVGNQGPAVEKVVAPKEEKAAVSGVPSLSAVGPASGTSARSILPAPALSAREVGKVNPEANDLAKKQHIEELFQRIQELKAADMYDEALWNEYLSLTEGKAGGRPTGHFDQGGETCALATVVPSVPYNDSGVLGATDDCVGTPYFDVFYVFTAPTAGSYTFDMCLSAGDTYERIWTAGTCCSGASVTADDECGDMDPTKTVVMTAGQTVYIECGYYYSTGGAGSAYNFNVTTPAAGPPNDECATAIQVAVPSTTNGTTIGGTNSCDYSGPDVFYWFELTECRQVAISLCATPDSLKDTQLTLYAGAANCCTANYLYSSDGGCRYSYYLSRIPYTTGYVNLNPGIYYINVDWWSTGGGTFVLDVLDGGPCGPPCEVACPTGGVPEGEPVCYDESVDNYNGGCNSSPYVFSPIVCGETVCGTSGTFLFTGLQYRDTDWFRLELTEATTLTWKVVAEFPLLIFVMNAGTENCVDYAVLGSATAAACDTASLTFNVMAGVYWLWVGPSVFTGVPCGTDAEYVGTVTCGTAGPCVECPPGGTIEDEPTCYDEFDDTYNGGCNSTIPVFDPIACGETICGTSGTFLFGGGQYRDTDWFEYTFTSGGYIFNWSAVAEFPVLIFVIAGAGPSNCSSYTILASATANACDTARIITTCQSPGTYWFWVGPSVFTGVPCGAEYVATLGCVPCTPPVCTPDFTCSVSSTQSYTNTSTTCGALNDCATRPSEDHIYEVNVLEAGNLCIK